MEHWNNENPDTTSIESPPSRTLRSILETIALNQYENYKSTSSDVQSDMRRKIQNLLATRLSYLFPKSDGIHLSRKWVTHGPPLPQYDMLFDQETMDLILSKPVPEDNNLDEIWEEGIRQMNILLVLLSYIVKIHFPKVSDEIRNDRTKEILKLTLELSQNGHRSDTSKEKLSEIWNRYRSFNSIQTISQTSVDYELNFELIDIIASILKTTPEIIASIAEENFNIGKILKYSRTYIASWIDELNNVKRIQEQNFDKLQYSMFFTEDDSKVLLYDIEVGFLYCLFGALPYKKQSDFNKLQNDNWEIISKETRTHLIEYIQKMSCVPDIMLRYIKAYDEVDCQNQIDETLLKLRNPWFYRIRKKIIQIAEIIGDNDIPADKLSTIEDTLDGLLVELKPFDVI